MICIIDVSDELLGTTTAFRFCCTPCIILFLLFCHSIARSLLLALWSFTSHRRIDLGLLSLYSIRAATLLATSYQITERRPKAGRKGKIRSKVNLLEVPWEYTELFAPPERCDLNRLNQPLLQLLLSNGIHMHITVGHIIVLQNYSKSLIQHCERRELCFHFEWTKVH